MQRTLFAIIACVLSSLGAAARAAEPPIHVEYDADAFKSKVTIAARDGRIAWGDVVRGVSRVHGYDDAALDGAMPNLHLRLTGSTAQYLIRRVNASGGRVVQLHVEQPAADGEPLLVIEMDHEAALSAERQAKARVRAALLPKSRQGRRYGIVMQTTSGAPSDQNDLVLFIHGLNSHPQTLSQLTELARRNNLAATAFHYPNDQPIEDSGRLLSEELKRLRASRPDLRVMLVTHSMGGLVARTALETPELDPGNVTRLVMISPPNYGSQLAQFAFGLDVWENLHASNREDAGGLFYSSIEDGLAEATVDLQPGSIYLAKLNRRERNPHVRYSIFLGTGGPCTREQLTDVRRRIQSCGRYCAWGRFLGSKIDAAVADLDEVVGGYGDGAVAVKRGRLAGVSDTVVLEFDHLSVLHHTDDPAVQQVYAEVLKRLTTPCESGGEVAVMR
ncbi:MAG: hypothetical protein KDA41_02940 [Planctomycetales bacterium]|nr:hypothetical protein [Planctomycetales bacterium]